MVERIAQIAKKTSLAYLEVGLEKLGSGLGKTGTLVGQTLGGSIVNYERYQSEKFDIKKTGLDNLKPVAQKPFIIAANHLEPEDIIHQLLGGAPDSFVFESVINTEVPSPIVAVANGDFMAWISPFKPTHKLQRTAERFLTGFLEGTGDVITAKLNPGSVNVEFVRKIKDAITHGRPILMFAEGTWYKDWDKAHDLKQGTAYIAKMFGLPIIPAYIHGATSWKSGTKVELSFGEAIDPNGKTKEEITTQIRQGITSLQEASRS